MKDKNNKPGTKTKAQATSKPNPNRAKVAPLRNTPPKMDTVTVRETVKSNNMPSKFSVSDMAKRDTTYDNMGGMKIKTKETVNVNPKRDPKIVGDKYNLAKMGKDGKPKAPKGVHMQRIHTDTISYQKNEEMYKPKNDTTYEVTKQPKYVPLVATKPGSQFQPINDKTLKRESTGRREAREQAQKNQQTTYRYKGKDYAAGNFVGGQVTRKIKEYEPEVSKSISNVQRNSDFVPRVIDEVKFQNKVNKSYRDTKKRNKGLL